MFISYKNNLISLEPFIESDAKLFCKWDVDEKVQEFMPEPHTVASTKEEQYEYIKECNDTEEEIHAIIIDNISNTRIGTIAVTDINEYHGIGELGIVIGNVDFWGKGFATEATNLILEYIKANTKIRRILAECESENIGERKVLEKCGFYLECISKESRIKNGKPIDTARYVWTK